ncbi:MAG: DivIVA domain-containing protein [Firmicutes bacterium]|nr:DivIVA domain-containing protein [Bacillota bacterium]
MPDRFMHVKRGYDPEEVDKYIDSLEAVIKSYKEKDSAIKNAILSAQIAADNIVKNAGIQVADSKAKTLAQVRTIADSVGAQRAKVLEFQREYNVILEKYVHKFNESDIQAILDKIDAFEKYVAKLGYDTGEAGAAGEGALVRME